MTVIVKPFITDDNYRAIPASTGTPGPVITSSSPAVVKPRNIKPLPK